MGFNLLDASKKFASDPKNERHLAINALVTPSDATNIVTQYNYANQRPYSKNHVLVLAEAIRRGEFREFTSIDFAVLNGIPHLINGQHTLRAIAAANISRKLSVHLHEVRSTQDIESLYSKYDIGRTRSLRDAMGAIGEEIGLSVKLRLCLRH